MSTVRRKASSGPVPLLHNINVTLSSDPRIDTLLDQAATIIDQDAESRLRVETVLAEIMALQDQVSEALRLIRRVIHMEKSEMVKLADLQAAVEEQTSITDSVVTLVGDLATKLQEALDNGSDAEIQAVIDQMNANKEKLASAVSANVPEPAPEPEPEPLPEPPPEPEPEPNA